MAQLPPDISTIAPVVAPTAATLGGSDCDGNVIAEFLRIALQINLWFVGKLPSLSLPESMYGAIDDFLALLSAVDDIVPLNHFFAAMTFIIAVHNFRFLITLWNFILSKIPFIS